MLGYILLTCATQSCHFASRKCESS